jgi:Flp pilus assembly protein TadD
MDDAAIVCRECGLPPEAGYAMPLCPECRKKLSARPYPQWIRVTGVALAVCLLVAMLQFPSHLKAGIAFERAQRAEAASQYAEAAVDYEKALQCFPDSDDLAARYGLALYHAGQTGHAVAVFFTLQGKKIPSERAEEVNAALDELERKAASMRHRGGKIQ